MPKRNKLKSEWAVMSLRTAMVSSVLKSTEEGAGPHLDFTNCG